MGEFSLSDGAGETRLLREHTTGYSVPLPGRPTLVTLPEGSPRYDAVIRLQDVPVEHGFRLDLVPSTVDPQALAKALATAYATTRAGIPQNVATVAQQFRPPGVFGSHKVYTLASSGSETMLEQLWLLVRPSANGALVLYATTRFRTIDLDQIEWAHLRGSTLDQHRWDMDQRDVPVLWPEGTFIRSSGKLALTDAASEEGRAKAAAIGPLADEVAVTFALGLREIAQAEQPARYALVPGQLEECMRRIASCGSSRAAEAMLSNIERCKTMHDLRGWVWQCVWAMRNRT